MRKLLLGLVAATALAGSSAASAVEFVGSTLGCLSLTSAPCTPVSSSTVAGLTFSTGSFDQFSSSAGYVGIGGTANPGTGLIDSLGFFSQDGSPNAYFGDFFTLLVNFTLPTGASGVNGGKFFATLTGQVSGANNGGVTIKFNPSDQIFHSSVGDFTLSVNNVTVGGGNANVPITGAIQMAPVPEPATWALMLLGFGGIGFAMRRRRRPILAQLA